VARATPRLIDRGDLLAALDRAATRQVRIISAPAGSPQAWRHGGYANYQEGTATPNAIVLTGYGPPEVLKWAEVPLVEPGEGQIRIKVKAAGPSVGDGVAALLFSLGGYAEYTPAARA